VTFPKDVKPITNKWVFKTKFATYGKVVKLKDHLVAQGYEQQKGFDFDEMFVLVVKWGTIQTMVAVVERHWEVKHLNVKITFISGDIQEQVYMIQPQGFVEFAHEDKICLLLKTIHGLKQAT
jgi:histone deacetylase 1/2